MADRANFLLFIRNQMGISSSVLPDNSTDIDNALALSLEIVHPFLAQVSTLISDTAVYNLGGHFIMSNAQDVTPIVIYKDGLPYFQYWRKQWLMNTFLPGVVSASSDEGTSTTITVPEAANKFTMNDLDYMKTPFGRVYMGMAQRVGANWGIT